MRLAGAMLAMLLLAGGCAHRDGAGSGRIYSYVRSNRDGSEAETIHVYRPRADYVEVTKMRARCTNAAFVTATLRDGAAARLTGGRLRPGAAHEDFAELVYRDGRIDARVTTPGGELRQSVAVADRPWHLYDFDLASFAAAPPGRGQGAAGLQLRCGFDLAGRRPGRFPSLSRPRRRALRAKGGA